MEKFSVWISKWFNLPLLNRNRYNWVDYLRGIVILLVVYHHTYLGIQRSGIPVPATVADANMVFYSFRMPLFFIISGVFTSLSLGKRSVNELVNIKFDKILYPYLVWAFLQVSLQITLSNFTNAARDFDDFLYILYQPRQLDQFWYLPALFNATMVFIFVKTRLKPSIGVHLLTGLVLYLLSPFLSEISMVSDWMRYYVFFAAGDLVAGFIFREKVQAKVKKPLLFLVFLPLFIGAQVFYLNQNVGAAVQTLSAWDIFSSDPSHYLLNEVNFLWIAYLGCATLILFSFLLEKWNKLSFLRIIGYHSLYIYIIHVIIVGFVRLLLTRVFHITDISVILVTALVLGVTLPIIFYNLWGKTSLWFLFSPRKKTQRITPVKPKMETIEILQVPRGTVEPDISST